MAQPGTDQHESRVHLSTTRMRWRIPPIQSFNDLVDTDASPAFGGIISVTML